MSDGLLFSINRQNDVASEGMIKGRICEDLYQSLVEMMGFIIIIIVIINSHVSVSHYIGIRLNGFGMFGLVNCLSVCMGYYSMMVKVWTFIDVVIFNILFCALNYVIYKLNVKFYYILIINIFVSQINIQCINYKKNIIIKSIFMKIIYLTFYLFY